MKRTKVIVGIIGFILTFAILGIVFGPAIINGERPSYLSFALTNFMGHIFFMTVPTEELIYVYYLSLGNSKIIMFFLAISTALIAQFIDYSIGYTVRKNLLMDILGKKKEKKFHALINKYGNKVIFLFNVLPLSSPIICLVAGMAKYDLKRTMYYSMLGLGLKYLIISALIN